MAEIDNVFSLMKERNVTPKEISEKTGISTGNISDWKSGRCAPKTEALIKIADYFGVSLDYLLGRTNDCSVNFNTVTDNHGIIGHNHAPVTIINGSERKLSEQEVALINLFEKLDVLKKAQLLTYAAKLTEEGL